MALLDPLVRILARLFGLREAFNRRQQIVDETSGTPSVSEEELEEFQQMSPQQQAEFLERQGDRDTLVQELLEGLIGGTFDTLEDAIDDELTERDLTDLQNAELNINDAEGVALSEAAALIGGQTVIEGLTAGQVDSFETPVAEVLSFLALDDIVGSRIGVTMQEAVLPSFEAQIGKQHRTKFVSLPDAVEALLRAKTADEGWLSGDNVDPRWADAVGSNDPVNPDNLIEEWGIRDDNLDILERVSLEAVEIEELIESPVQFGIIPTAEEADDVLEISGLPESTKDLFRRTIEAAPRSADLWEQRSTGDETVTQLDALVDSGEISPITAAQFLPDELENARPALVDRWEILADLPNKAPTRSQVESSFAAGLTDLDTLEDRLERIDIDPEIYDDVVTETILSDIDGSLQQAMALGFISEGTYGQLMDRVGLDADAQQALMAGQDLTDVVERRLQETAEADAIPVAALPSIGEQRADALAIGGIETVADMAQADAETVAELAGISEERAGELISLAQRQAG